MSSQSSSAGIASGFVTVIQCFLFRCHPGTMLSYSARSSTPRSGGHFTDKGLGCSVRRINRNIFPCTLKTSTSSPKGKPSSASGRAKAKSRIASNMGEEWIKRVKVIVYRYLFLCILRFCFPKQRKLWSFSAPLFSVPSNMNSPRWFPFSS